MANFILAGIPKSSVSRLKDTLERYSPSLDGWNWMVLPSHQNRKAEIVESQIEYLLEEAEKLHGAHIFGFSEKRDRDQILWQVKAYFRFRWFDASLVSIIGTDPKKFVDELSITLNEESVWREEVMPKNHSSPLVLPESEFKTSGRFSQLWRLSESYNSSTKIAAASKLAADFRENYKRRIDGIPKTPWVDDASRVWNDSGPWHGTAPFPRDWKYSHRLPDGFHFDVNHCRGQKFEVIDRTEERLHVIKSGGYVNVDAHGFIR